MPYIDINITNKLDEQEKDRIKSKLVILMSNDDLMLLKITSNHPIIFNLVLKLNNPYMSLLIVKTSSFNIDATGFTLLKVDNIYLSKYPLSNCL